MVKLKSDNRNLLRHHTKHLFYLLDKLKHNFIATPTVFPSKVKNSLGALMVLFSSNQSPINHYLAFSLLKMLLFLPLLQ
ncbi:MAG: hypothetical protein IJR82_00915, partial [Bacilli bacterium]|nr:hypothetical protein [Bacilli bacterium]